MSAVTEPLLTQTEVSAVATNPTPSSEGKEAKAESDTTDILPKDKPSRVILWVGVGILILGGLAALFIFVIYPRFIKKPKPNPQPTTVSNNLNVSAPSISALTAGNTGAGVSLLNLSITLSNSSSDPWTSTITVSKDSAGQTVAVPGTDYSLVSQNASYTLTTNANTITFTGTGSVDSTSPIVLQFTNLTTSPSPLYVAFSTTDTTSNNSSPAQTPTAIYPIYVSSLTTNLASPNVSVVYEIQSNDASIQQNLTTAYLTVTDTNTPPNNILGSTVTLATSPASAYTISNGEIDLGIGKNASVTAPTSPSVTYTIAPSAAILLAGLPSSIIGLNLSTSYASNLVTYSYTPEATPSVKIAVTPTAPAS